MSKVYTVRANIELDIEAIAKEIARRDGVPVSEVTEDDIFEYVENHVTYLKDRNNAVGIEQVADGPTISGWGDDSTYERIAEILDTLL